MKSQNNFRTNAHTYVEILHLVINTRESAKKGNISHSLTLNLTFKLRWLGNVTFLPLWNELYCTHTGNRKSRVMIFCTLLNEDWRRVNSGLALFNLQFKKPSSNYFLVSPLLYSHLLHPLWPFNWMWQQSNVSVSISLIEGWRSLPAVVLERTLIPEKAKARLRPLDLAWLLTAPNWLLVWAVMQAGCDTKG